MVMGLVARVKSVSNVGLLVLSVVIFSIRVSFGGGIITSWGDSIVFGFATGAKTAGGLFAYTGAKTAGGLFDF